MAKLCTEKRHGVIVQFVPRPRRIVVRITAARGLEPIGRTRPLMIRESDLARLVEAAERLEAQA